MMLRKTRHSINRLYLTIIGCLIIGISYSGICYGDFLIKHLNVNDSEPYIPRLTRGVTQEYFDRELFGKTGHSALTYFYDGSNFKRIGFVSDWDWDRIVYADWESNWIKAYGPDEENVQHRLFNPLDICANNGNGDGGGNIAWVFVVENGFYDRFESRVLKLRYEYAAEQLFFDEERSLSTDNRKGFNFICLHDNGTMADVSDDYLWVVDLVGEKLLNYLTQGTKGVQREVSLPMGSGVGQIVTLGDIVCGRNITGENDDTIYLLDGANRRVVMYYDAGGSLTYSGTYQFDETFQLSSIETDLYGHIYIVEERYGQIFKLTPDLELVSSYQPGPNPPNGLIRPVDISTPRGTVDYPGWADICISERWSDTSGGQWYQIGTKLLDESEPTIWNNRHSIKIPYKCSDAHFLDIIVLRKTHGTFPWDTVEIISEAIPRYSGWSNLTWTVFDTTWGDPYKFEITGSSTYQRLSGEPVDQFYYAVPERKFGTRLPVVTQEIYISNWDEDCVEYWSPGDGPRDTIKVAGYDPEGEDLKYILHTQNCCFYYPGGPNTITSYSPSPAITYIAPESGGPTYDYISCTLDDQHGGTTISRNTLFFYDDCSDDPDPDPDPPCPTLYVQTGKTYEIDNNILSASEDTEQAPGFLRDYYLLQREPSIDKNGYIHLQLREDEYQTTTFDGLRLTVAWVDEGREIGISDQGTVFYPIQIKTPVSVCDGSGDDRLQQLDTKDGNSFTSHAPGELIINFGKVRKSSLSASVQASDDGPGLPPPDKNMEKISPYGDPASGNILRVDVMDESGNWVKTGIVPPRKFASFNYIDLSDWVRDDEDLWVRLRWDYAYSIDHLAYYDFDDTGIKLEEFAPATVFHSSFGDAREALITNGDDAATTLSPGEVILLSFGPIPKAPEGKIAKYVLTCIGRYTTDESDFATGLTAPEGASLKQNTPNPFNASTVIEFSLPHDGNVRLEVYDVLGRRVRLLIDDNKPAGYHSIAWNGRDDGGVPVASGIYFYRLTTEDFAESRKMILVK